MDKKETLIEMINSINDADTIDYLYVLVKDVYDLPTHAPTSELSPAESC